jgi:hypothetical protein
MPMKEYAPARNGTFDPFLYAKRRYASVGIVDQVMREIHQHCLMFHIQQPSRADIVGKLSGMTTEEWDRTMRLDSPDPYGAMECQ